MSDLKKYIHERKKRDRSFAEGYDEGYEQFKTGVVLKHARESASLTQGWHEGKHSLLPWWEYFLGVMLLSAYKEFEQRVGLVSTAKGAKTATVLDAVRSMKGEFSVKDV